MKLTKKLKALALSAAALCGITAGPAMAQNPNYAPGDIVLFFQQFGGSNTVMLNVGAATTFRDATSNILSIANIGSLLSDGTNGFGSSWYDTSSLWWGAAGVRSNSTSTTSQTDGDPGRTLYVSRNRTAVGTEGSAGSSAWVVDSNGSMTTGANGIIAMANRMETTSMTTTLVEGTSASNIDNQNLFNILGSPTTSFGVLPSGGVQGNFGAGSFGTFGGVAAEGALDLYRILATTAPVGTVTDGVTPAREGTYEGTFVIDQTGDVSYILQPIPEPTTMGATLFLGLAAGAMRRRRRVTA
jgi:hypothetical protein